MIEQIVLDYLSRSFRAYMEVPEDFPGGDFVVIEKTGGGEADQIARSTIIVQSYGPTLYRAADLNRRVKIAMKGLTELPEISRASLNSDYNYTDTSTKRYRYQAVFDITHYEGG